MKSCDGGYYDKNKEAIYTELDDFEGKDKIVFEVIEQIPHPDGTTEQIDLITNMAKKSIIKDLNIFFVDK